MLPPSTHTPPVLAKCLQTLNFYFKRGVKARNLYVGYPDTLTRNRRFWAYGPNYSCISPWNSAGGSYRAGTLIGEQHALFAEHYKVGIGTTVKWISMRDAVVTRKVISTHKYPVVGSDLWVVKLKSPIPRSTIMPCKLFTADMLAGVPITNSRFTDTYTMTWYDISGFPMYYMDAQEKLSLARGNILNHLENHPTSHSSFSIQPPVNPKWKAFYEVVVGGDSGNPIFTVYTNEMYLFGVFGSGGGGCWIGDSAKIAWLTQLGVFKKAEDTPAEQPAPEP